MPEAAPLDELIENGALEPANSRVRTRRLFYEHFEEGTEGSPLYTLRNQDYRGYASLKRLYLDFEDLVEYDFAEKYMPRGYPQWEALCNSVFFKKHIEQWRKELDLKIRARELRRIMEMAKDNGKEAQQAAKFLITRGYADKQEKTRGRPSKQEVINEVHRMAEQERSLDEDYDRITKQGIN